MSYTPPPLSPTDGDEESSCAADTLPCPSSMGFDEERLNSVAPDTLPQDENSAAVQDEEKALEDQTVIHEVAASPAEDVRADLVDDKTETNANSEVVGAPEETMADDEDDEFGDFADFADASPSWAAFDDAAAASTTEDDWPTRQPPAQSLPSTDELSEQPIAESLPTCSALLEEGGSVFSDLMSPFGDDDRSVEMATTLAHLLDPPAADDDNPPSTSSIRRNETLWPAVRSVEDALALQLQWLTSRLRQRLMQALLVDANLARVRSSNLPAFAAQLTDSLLTPRQGTCDGGRQQEMSSPVAAAAAPSASTASDEVDSLAVPPVQFDWRSSGLRNPLNNSAASVILDLDFLTANQTSSKPGAVPKALQNDLRSLGLDSTCKPPPENPPSAAKNNGAHTSTLAALLESRQATTTVAVSAEATALQGEARTLHDNLPELGFMLSPVLMFPVKSDQN